MAKVLMKNLVFVLDGGEEQEQFYWSRMSEWEILTDKGREVETAWVVKNSAFTLSEMEVTERFWAEFGHDLTFILKGALQRMN